MLSFVKRLLRGEDVLIVTQDDKKWNVQFAKGSWDYLMNDHPNTKFIADLVLREVEARHDPVEVIDCGCGNGALAVLLEKEIAEGNIRYIGTDISSIAIEQAKRRVPKADFRALGVEQLPPEMASADFLVFNEVLYYVNPHIVLPQYAKAVKKGTRVVISIIRTWRSPFLWSRIRKHVSVEKKFVARDERKRQQFDIVTASFK